MANALETKTITNIYYDCLERIFDFLDLESLLMVANTCKRLRTAAAAKFGDECGGKRIVLDVRGFDEPSLQLYHPKTIQVNGLKFCLPFLRCFGGKIQGLNIFYASQGSNDEHLNHYINGYCADTLTSITMFFKSNFANVSFVKPFKNVERVRLIDCHLSQESLPNFVEWFPDMRHLDMTWCSIGDTASMDAQFPQLISLKICMAPNLQNGNVMNLLQSNPQLQILEFSSPFETALDKFLDKIRDNSNITGLKMNFLGGQAAVGVNELDRVAAEHPNIIEQIMIGYVVAANDAINFIHRMRSLKRIQFEVSCRSEWNRITTEFEVEWKIVVPGSVDGARFYIKLVR